jgi:hypothetical protein
MNNWPNPNATGEPLFPEVMRAHFLTCAELQADKDVIANASFPVMRDTLMPGIWHPETRSWLIQDMEASMWQVAKDFSYVSPAYTEADMRDARIETAAFCERLIDEAIEYNLTDGESFTAGYCANQIEIYRKSL